MIYNSQWERLFRKVRGNYNKTEWVEKENLSPLPSTFSEGSSFHLFHPLASKVYRERENRDLIVIREFPNKYSIQYDQYHPEEHLGKHLLYDRTGELVLGAGILASIVIGGYDSQSRAQKISKELDPREYNIFISHSWSYDDHYERIEEFLNEIDKLDWKNYSIPQEKSIDASTKPELREGLRKQIKGASVVLVTSGMYGAYSDWIEEELIMADDMDKPIIGIRPEGNEQIPSIVKEYSDEITGWRKASVISAIAEHGELN